MIRYLLPFFFWNLCLFSSITSVSAQEVTTSRAVPIRFTETQVRDFKTGLQFLADQGHIAIIAEASPLPRTLDSETVHKLTERSFSLLEAIESFATAYDYEISHPDKEKRGHRHDRVIVLKKRYTDESDVPDLSPEECIHTVKLIRNLLDQYGPQPPVVFQTDLVLGIYHQLTPDNLTQMAKEGLPITQLNSTQKSAIWRLAVYTYLGLTIDSATSISWYLNNYLTWDITEQMDNEIFPPDLSMGFAEKDQFGRAFFRSIHTTQLQKTASMGSDKEEEKTVPEYDSVDTLENMVTRLNLRTPGTEQEGRRQKFRVDDRLSQKTITTAGEDFAPSGQLLDAMVEVYGLRITGGETRTLNVQPLPKLRSLLELPLAFHTLLPEPLRRIEERKLAIEQNLSQQLSDYFSEEEVKKRSNLPQNEVEKRFYALCEKRFQMRETDTKYNEMRKEIYRRIRRNIEKLHDKDPSIDLAKGVPVTQLDYKVRSGLAVNLLIGMLSTLGETLDLTNAPVSRFEDAILKGKTYKKDGKKYFDILFFLPDLQTGQLSMYGGIKEIELDTP